MFQIGVKISGCGWPGTSSAVTAHTGSPGEPSPARTAVRQGHEQRRISGTGQWRPLTPAAPHGPRGGPSPASTAVTSITSFTPTAILTAAPAAVASQPEVGEAEGDLIGDVGHPCPVDVFLNPSLRPWAATSRVPSAVLDRHLGGAATHLPHKRSEAHPGEDPTYRCRHLSGYSRRGPKKPVASVPGPPDQTNSGSLRSF